MTLESVLDEELLAGGVSVVPRLLVSVEVVVGVVRVDASFVTRRGVVVVGGVCIADEIVVDDVVIIGGAVATGGAAFDVAVSVKTKTSSNRGLDHVTQCVLLRERDSFMRVLQR
ncbi:MAG TPA: hypothetical protein VII67_05160 [Acidimicrobiales bacterium]